MAEPLPFLCARVVLPVLAQPLLRFRAQLARVLQGASGPAVLAIDSAGVLFSRQPEPHRLAPQRGAEHGFVETLGAVEVGGVARRRVAAGRERVELVEAAAPVGVAQEQRAAARRGRLGYSPPASGSTSRIALPFIHHEILFPFELLLT